VARKLDGRGGVDGSDMLHRRCYATRCLGLGPREIGEGWCWVSLVGYVANRAFDSFMWIEWKHRIGKEGRTTFLGQWREVWMSQPYFLIPDIEPSKTLP